LPFVFLIETACSKKDEQKREKSLKQSHNRASPPTTITLETMQQKQICIANVSND